MTGWAPRREVSVVVGAAIGLATGIGGLYFSTLSVFLRPIASYFHLSRTMASGAVVLAMLGMVVGAPLYGRLIDRFGARPMILLSAVLLSLSLLTFPMLPANAILFAGLSFLAGASASATGANGYLSVFPFWFDRRLGAAMAFAMIGVGLGASLLPVLSRMLVEQQGWQYAYRVLAAIALLGGVTGCLLLGRDGRHPVSVAAAHGEAMQLPPGLTFKEALRDPPFWMILAALFLVGAAGFGMTIHLAAMFDDGGQGGRVATAVFASGIGLMLGRVAAGFLMDRFDARFVGAVGFMLGAVALLLLFLSLNGPAGFAWAGALLLGCTLGAEGDFAAFVVRRYFGVKALATIYGVFFSAYSFGGVCGAIAFGAAYDRLGNYEMIVTLAGIFFVVAALSVGSLGSYRFATQHPSR